MVKWSGGMFSRPLRQPLQMAFSRAMQPRHPEIMQATWLRDDQHIMVAYQPPGLRKLLVVELSALTIVEKRPHVGGGCLIGSPRG